MTGSDVSSRSALATITIPSSMISSDPLVALVVAISPPFQTNVIIIKKKNDTAFSLTVGPDTLTHRNSILRYLCGSGLHNALDSLRSSPLLFLGGHSASSFAGASPTSALAMAGISSWMSVASSIRDDGGSSSSSGDESVSKLLGQLNGYLATRSFLVPSSAPTLADLDLYLAMLSKVSGEKLEAIIGEGGGNDHIRRWLEQCSVTLDELHVVAVKNSHLSKIPIPTLPQCLSPKSKPLPLFYYGDDDNIVAAEAKSSSTTISTSAGGKEKEKGYTGKPVGETKQGGPAVELTDEEKRAVAEKRAKKAAGKAKAKEGGDANKGGVVTTATEAVLNISALDIRVGKIIKVWEHESSDKLFCEEVDVGEEKPRLIASGLRAFYKLEEMQNRSVLVLCNLKARNLGGFPSHGMVLCASNDDHTAVEFAVPPEGAKIGERVCFEGFDGQPEAENKVAKKKIFEALAPDLKTDGNGEVVWKGAKGSTSAGVCKAVNGMANAHVS